MIITRAEKRTKVPKREKISELAKHGATMIFYLSVHLISNIVKEALAGGYPKSTPVGVVYRASWDDQKIITFDNIRNNVVRVFYGSNGFNRTCHIRFYDNLSSTIRCHFDS